LLPKFFGIGKATWQQGTVLLALIEGMALCDDDSIGEHDQDSVEAIVFLSLKRDCTRRNAKYTIEVLALGRGILVFA